MSARRSSPVFGKLPLQDLENSETCRTFAPRNQEGEVLEWLKRHAWKACIPLKGIGGSNPPLSATVLNKMEN